MSTPSDPKHPDQKDQLDEKDGTKVRPGHSEQSKKDDRELPGAEGPNSAGANEDTYD